VPVELRNAIHTRLMSEILYQDGGSAPQSGGH
jgi:hypothetical protein